MLLLAATAQEFSAALAQCSFASSDALAQCCFPSSDALVQCYFASSDALAHCSLLLAVLLQAALLPKPPETKQTPKQMEQAILTGRELSYKKTMAGSSGRFCTFFARFCTFLSSFVSALYPLFSRKDPNSHKRGKKRGKKWKKCDQIIFKILEK